jgi:cyclic pyranopterin phosphate synthase
VPSETSSDLGFEGQTRGLTHIDSIGNAHMVDVTAKPWTRRRAVARCRVTIGPSTVRRSGDPVPELPIAFGALSEVFAPAKIAGIQAAKDTAGLVPLCHLLPGLGIEVRIALLPDGIGIESVATTTGPTGVEMEALTACAFAALSVVSLLQDTHSCISIDELELWEKSGGRSGSWER